MLCHPLTHHPPFDSTPSVLIQGRSRAHAAPAPANRVVVVHVAVDALDYAGDSRRDGFDFCENWEAELEHCET